MTRHSTKAEIRASYVGLRDTYFSLVGTLYPAIAYQELMELRERYVAGTGSFWGDLPTVAQPRTDRSTPHGW